MDEARRLVLKFFSGDEKKTDLWFRTPNPLLGGLMPRNMNKVWGAERFLEWVEARLAENEPALENQGCRHGHVPSYNEPTCLECSRDNARDFAYEEAARILDEEVGQHPGMPFVGILRGLAEQIRGLKEKEPRTSITFDALCPICGGTGHEDGIAATPCCHCGGRGKMEARLAEGVLYNHECTKCGNHIGGCVVGGESPLKEVPKSKECPFCGGPTRYVPMGDI